MENKPIKPLDLVREKFGEAVVETHSQAGDDTVVLEPRVIHQALEYLKTDPECDFNILTDLTCVDRLHMRKRPRFEVVYHLYSLNQKHRLRVKTRVEEHQPEVATVTDLWGIANWFEREAWDMFGVVFLGHPNLTRILLYPEFQGHPLRKDYPYYKRQPLVGPKN